MSRPGWHDGGVSHALVIGGTGMLRDATLWLAGRHDTVSVVARSTKDLEALRAEAPAGTIQPLARDYRDGEAFANALLDTQEVHGPVDLAVCWVHAVAPDAPLQVAQDIVAERLAQGLAEPLVYVHVLGSASADPSRDSGDARGPFEELGPIDDQQVVLGFVLEGDSSRWLTNAEISRGAIAAIDHAAQRHIVGAVRPWDRRP